jgi:hypothetical protein
VGARRATTTTTVTMSAIAHTPATIHAARWFGAMSGRAAASPPDGAPHAGQNLARALSCAPHLAHAAPASGAPQALQNLPVDSAPQAGHFWVAGLAIGES